MITEFKAAHVAEQLTNAADSLGIAATTLDVFGGEEEKATAGQIRRLVGRIKEGDFGAGTPDELRAKVRALEAQNHGFRRMLTLLAEHDLPWKADFLRASLGHAGSPEADTPEQAWYRGAALMRAAFHQHAKLEDDSPLWGIEIPEYRAP